MLRASEILPAGWGMEGFWESCWLRIFSEGKGRIGAGLGDAIPVFPAGFPWLCSAARLTGGGTDNPQPALHGTAFAANKTLP